MKFDVVKCYWRDAQTYDTWHELSEIEDECPLICSVGFLVKSTKDIIVIATTVAMDGMSNAGISIPIGMIEKMEKL